MCSICHYRALNYAFALLLMIVSFECNHDHSEFMAINEANKSNNEILFHLTDYEHYFSVNTQPNSKPQTLIQGHNQLILASSFNEDHSEFKQNERESHELDDSRLPQKHLDNIVIYEANKSNQISFHFTNNFNNQQTNCSDFNQNAEQAFYLYPILMVFAIFAYLAMFILSSTLYLERVILYYCLFGAFAVSHCTFINCVGSKTCEDAVFSCNQTEPCDIYCSGRLACTNARMNCATHQLCNITCSGEKSCLGSIINCPRTENCTISTPGGDSAMRQSVINCGKSAICDITSSGGESALALYNIIINCPMGFGYDCIIKAGPAKSGALLRATINGGNGDLSITVSADGTMESATINCPLNSWNKCDIMCVGSFQTCAFMDVHGNNSVLTINATRTSNDNNHAGILYNAIIHCPENDDGNKKCNINVRPSGYIDTDTGEVFTGDMELTQIFAKNSFADVNLWCESQCFEDEAAFMLCTDDVSLNSFCEIKAVTHNDSNDEWICADTSSVCHPPTTKPTTYPTVATSSPSYDPTPSPTFKLYDSPNIVYVERNASCDYGYCQNPIDINHTHIYCNMTSYLDNLGPPCSSLDYAFNCIQGIGGNDVVCSSKYSKHGGIHIGKGTFNFTSGININDAQFVFEGANAMDTHLVHKSDIYCEWRCKLAFNSLSYAAAEEMQHLITSYDDAQIIFENVIFHQNGFSDAQSITFSAYNGALIKFINCSFMNMNHVFIYVDDEAMIVFNNSLFSNNNLIVNITGDAFVLFEYTEFYNNSASDLTSSSMIDIKSSTVSFNNCLFQSNHHYSSLIQNIHNTGSDISLFNLYFNDNVNIHHIYYEMNTNPAIITTILQCKFVQNNCTEMECIKVLDTSLNIDALSTNVFIPTTDPSPHPTFSPILSPTQPTSSPTYDTVHCGDQISYYRLSYIVMRFELTLDYETDLMFDFCGTSLYKRIWRLYNASDAQIEYGSFYYLCDFSDCDPAIHNWHYAKSSISQHTCGMRVLYEIPAGVYYIELDSANAVEKGQVKVHINCDPLNPSFEPTQHPTFVPYHIVLEVVNSEIKSRTKCLPDTALRASNHIYDGSNYTIGARCCDKFGLQPNVGYIKCLNGTFAEVQSLCSNHSLTLCPSSSFEIERCAAGVTGFWTSESCVPSNVSVPTSAPGITSNPTTRIPTKSPITSNPTLRPTIKPTGTPTTRNPTALTLNPTLSPTIDPNNRIITFGHTQNNTEDIILYLYDFHPQNIDQINLMYFGAENGSVSFETCALFETYTEENILFDQVLSATLFINASVFLSYSEPAELHADYVNCANTDECHIECINSPLTCFRSAFNITNINQIVTFKCNGTSACEQTQVFITEVTGIVAIKCEHESACKLSDINVSDVDTFTLDCVSSSSCLNSNINLNGVISATISCYEVNACESIRIYSSTDDVELFLYNYNNDIIINVPTDFIEYNLFCNLNDAYILLDSATSDTILETTSKQLFGGDLPCAGVTYKFFASIKPDCYIKYTFLDYPTYLLQSSSQTLRYFLDYMSCYHPYFPTFISDFSSYECFGTDSPTNAPTANPTQSPTSAPSRAPSLPPTAAPTHPPSNAPSLSPTNYPSDAPSFSPSALPSNAPSLLPTSIPSDAPTNVPSFAPSNAPSHAPINNPSLAPTFLPSNAPTNAPSLTPTASPTQPPTNIPTQPPTEVPSNAPTHLPSNAPSFSPTNVPTQSPSNAPTTIPTIDIDQAYDTIISIVYKITNLTARDIHWIADNVDEFVSDTQRTLEQNYFDPETLLYEQFFVRIIDINDIKIDDDKLSIYDLDVVYLERPMLLNTEIQCAEIDTGSIIKASGTTTFLYNTEQQMRAYLNNTYLQFTPLHLDNLAAGVSSKTQYTQPADKTAFIFSIIVVIIGCIASLLAFIYNKVPIFTKTDNASFLVPLLFALNIYDFVSDINLSVEIFSNNDISLKSIYLWIGVASVFFIVAPFAANVFYATTITQQATIQNNPAARAYFGKHLSQFIVLCVMNTGTFPVLSLLSSRIFGLEIFETGLLSSELHELSKIKIRSTIFLENVPQICLQILYSVFVGIQPATRLAFVASSLSVIASVVVYRAQIQQEQEAITSKYFLRFSQENNALLTPNEAENIRCYKGLKEKIANAFCAIFGISNKSIEIGFCTAIPSGCIFHVQHAIFKQDLEQLKHKLFGESIRNTFGSGLVASVSPQLFVQSIYDIHGTSITNALKNHFDLLHMKRFTVQSFEKYQNAIDALNIIDDDDDDDEEGHNGGNVIELQQFDTIQREKPQYKQAYESKDDTDILRTLLSDNNDNIMNELKGMKSEILGELKHMVSQHIISGDKDDDNADSESCSVI